MSTSPPKTPAYLPQPALGIPKRPLGSLERVEVTVQYDMWDVYRMEMADRWRRNHSADASLFSSGFPYAVGFFVLVYLLYGISFSTAWRDFVPGFAILIPILWGVWWAIEPMLVARRQAQAALLQPPVHFVFSPDGVEMRRLEVSMQIAWPGIRRVRETRSSILIYPRQSSPYVTAPDGTLIQVLPWMKLYFTVPLHCFTDAANLRLVRALLRKHVASDVKLRS